MQRRFINRKVTVEKRGDGDQAQPIISGYAAVYFREDDPDTVFQIRPGMTERIAPGAFDEAIRSDDVRGLFNHDPNMILGRTSAGTMRLSADATGLRYEIDPPDTGTGNDVRTAIKRGDVTGSSFSFDVLESGWIDNEDGTMIRVIRKARLYDVGPVTFPAYESTSAMARAAGCDDPTKPFVEHRAQVESQKKTAATLERIMRGGV
jgi:HK97 family phage prohead protease